jgi:hypothetical protein
MKRREYEEGYRRWFQISARDITFCAAITSLSSIAWMSLETGKNGNNTKRLTSPFKFSESFIH